MPNQVKQAILYVPSEQDDAINITIMSSMRNKQKNILLISLLIFYGLFMTGKINAAAKGYIHKAVFTTAIEERKPVDQVLLLGNITNKIYFHTELRHFQDQKIIHRWEYNGKVVSSKIFNVNGPRWRVYSAMTLSPDQLGTWRVVVTTEKGWPLKAVIFKYVDGGKEQNAILPFAK